MDIFSNVIQAANKFIQSNPLQRALDAISQAPRKRPHHVSAARVDRVEIGGSRPAPVPSQHDLRVKSARKLLAQANGDMGELPPALQRALIDDLKTRTPHQGSRIERGQRQFAERQARDNDIIEREMQSADAKVGAMRTGANVVTMGGSEEAMRARELAENGDAAGAAFHAGLAGLSCAGAAVTWMTAGGALRSTGRALSNAARNPSVVTETLAGAPTAARTAVSAAATSARNAPAAVMARLSQARTGASSLTAAQVYDKSVRTATALGRTLRTGDGFVQTAAAANTVPAAVSGARELPADLAQGKYGRAALDVVGVTGGVLGVRGTLGSVERQAVAMESEAAQRFRALESEIGGHSAARHGPHLKDMQQTTRITTGTAPDGVFSPTSSASRFQSWTDQERTLAQARRVAGPKLASLATTQNPPPVVVKLGHNRPLGTGFKGTGKWTRAEGQHGETARVRSEAVKLQSPLTNTQTTFAWREGASGGRYVPVQHFPTPKPTATKNKPAPGKSESPSDATTPTSSASPTTSSPPTGTENAPTRSPNAPVHDNTPSPQCASDAHQIEQDLKWYQR